MTTKTILTMAIIAALPIAAHAENISGAMYTAPATVDTNHPAPTTNDSAPYGRVNIDTADQEHIATTAYVKGAYNSAIAAVNKLNEEKSARLINSSADVLVDHDVMNAAGFIDLIADDDLYEDTIVSAAAVAAGIDYKLNHQPVKIYTTWDNDNATTSVTLGDINQ